MKNLFIVFGVLFLFACSNNDNIDIADIVIEAPEVETNSPVIFDQSLVTLSGNILSDGGSTIIERGFCWNTSGNPDINDNVISVQGSLGLMSYDIEEFQIGVKYFISAYAKNESEIGYGSTVEVKLSNQKILLSTSEFIKENIYQNKKDNILYLFLGTEIGSLIQYRMVAYNYELNEVVAERDLGLDYTSYRPIFDIKEYNGVSEIYTYKDSIVTILDGKSLIEIASFVVPLSGSCTGIKVVDDFIFIGVTGLGLISDPGGLRVYRRDGLEFVSESEFNLNARLIVPFYNNNLNEYICLSFPQFSNENNYLVERFDNQGLYISSEFKSYQDCSGKDIRINENLDYFLKGTKGCVFSKTNYDYEVDVMSPDDSVKDYQFSEDGNLIYSIDRDFKVEYRNSDNFDIIDYINIEEQGRNILLDQNEIIIIDYDLNSSINGELRDIYVSKYEL